MVLIKFTSCDFVMCGGRVVCVGAGGVVDVWGGVGAGGVWRFWSVSGTRRVVAGVSGGCVLCIGSSR